MIWSVTNRSVCYAMRRSPSAEAYYEHCERPPTRTEWERLFRDAVQPMQDLESTSTQPIIADAQVGPSAVHVVVETKE